MTHNHLPAVENLNTGGGELDLKPLEQTEQGCVMPYSQPETSPMSLSHPVVTVMRKQGDLAFSFSSFLKRDPPPPPPPLSEVASGRAEACVARFTVLQARCGEKNVE